MPDIDLIRQELIELHRALIDEQRRDYELAHGKTTPGQLLELLVSHEAFAWLGPFTTLIVELDDPTDGLDAWLGRARTLLRPDAAAGPFQRRYDELIQRSPDLVIAHDAAMRALAHGGSSS